MLSFLILKKKHLNYTQIDLKQESPPAWPQEAYHPPRIKYLLCCSVSGGGYPVLARAVPQSCPSWGVPQSYSFHGAGTGHPHHGLGYPHLELGYPLARTGVPPAWDWDTPLEKIWDQTPEKEPGTGVSPRKDLRWEMRDPPVWTDRLTPVKTLPSRHNTYAGGSKTKQPFITIKRQYQPRLPYLFHMVRSPPGPPDSPDPLHHGPSNPPDLTPPPQTMNQPRTLDCPWTTLRCNPHTAHGPLELLDLIPRPWTPWHDPPPPDDGPPNPSWAMDRLSPDPVNKITQTTENITFPHTTHVVGNKASSEILSLMLATKSMYKNNLAHYHISAHAIPYHIHWSWRVRRAHLADWTFHLVILPCLLFPCNQLFPRKLDKIRSEN